MTTTELRHVALDEVEADHNIRRRAVASKEMVASVKAHGIIEPLVATTDGVGGTGKVHLLAGYRRLDAARKAGLETVPVLVHETLEPAAREAFRLIENLHRENLSPIEEAVGILRLSELGRSTKAIGEAIGMSAAQVRDRLKLMVLPAKAKDRVHKGQWSMETALAVAKLDDAELREELAGYEHLNGYSIAQVVERKERKARFDKVVAELEAKGATMVERVERGWGAVGNDWKPTDPDTGRTFTPKRLTVEPKKHAGLACARFLLRSTYNGFEALQFCTTPKDHDRAKGTSAVREPEPAPAYVEAAERQRAERKRQREEAQARRDAATELAQGRVPKALLRDAMLEVCVTFIRQDAKAKPVCDLLGIEVAAKGGYADYSGALAKRTEADPERVVWAYLLAMALDGAYRAPATVMETIVAFGAPVHPDWKHALAALDRRRKAEAEAKAAPKAKGKAKADVPLPDPIPGTVDNGALDADGNLDDRVVDDSEAMAARGELDDEIDLGDDDLSDAEMHADDVAHQS